jgi:hypothetical protein
LKTAAQRDGVSRGLPAGDWVALVMAGMRMKGGRVISGNEAQTII